MNSFEKGKKIITGAVSVLDLNGTWAEMGRQYGALVSEQLLDIYTKAIVNRLVGECGQDMEQLRVRARKLYSNYPFRFKEIFKGMSQTSGLTLEQLQLVNAVEILMANELEQPGCTGIAVWGDYAADSLVYGRNYDYVGTLKKLADDIVMAVFHPADGSLSTAIIGYAGQIYAVNGMNEKGIFLELNNGLPSGGALWYDTRVPAIAVLFSFLLDGATLDEIESFFQTARANFAYVVGVTDGQTARCYEWPVFEVKRRESHTRPGLTVLSNHFTEPSWGLPRPDDKTFWMTRTRRQNLLALAKHLKGAIDSSTMMKVLDTKIEDLGATSDSTVYQIVTVPGKFKLWMKIPEHMEWTEFDMKELLRPREE